MLKINVHTSNDIKVVSPEGEIDLHSSPRMRKTLLDLFKKKMKGMVVDMSGVSRLDSAAIATLVEALQWSRKKGKPFALASMQEEVFNILKLARLSVYFEIFDTLEEAIAEFG